MGKVGEKVTLNRILVEKSLKSMFDQNVTEKTTEVDFYTKCN